MTSLRFVLLSGLLLFGCDSTPNTVAPNLNASIPQISSFQYSPKTIVFENLPASQRNGNVANVPLNISVFINDTDSNNMKRVQYTLYQFNGKVVTSGELTKNNGSNYSATPTVAFNKAEVGNYALKVQAIDTEGNFSNVTFGNINLIAEGGAPVLSAVNAPTQIQRPTAGNVRREKITATVTDPDGLASIAKVQMKALDGSEFELLDDGGKNGSISGDTTAGDGIYTITIQIESTNPLGQYAFDFQAIDRTAFRSNTIRKIIEVVQ
jgi:hypothetical protein